MRVLASRCHTGGGKEVEADVKCWLLPSLEAAFVISSAKPEHCGVGQFNNGSFSHWRLPHFFRQASHAGQLMLLQATAAPISSSPSSVHTQHQTNQWQMQPHNSCFRFERCNPGPSMAPTVLAATTTSNGAQRKVQVDQARHVNSH